eukprot:CAMPEP_0170466148 /NCGR_PEP_ID=MMETSP0123-20130129/10221_1 /TAXON_ID=182087 /ORGANISM="Favella ehrenbergii, Strain Fehren 1" /LENGTH=68 /DNA_ID=CAMNT_0010732213 /DNA_START=43 /DNA_END=249 /DNA_ORIENTATION=+
MTRFSSKMPFPPRHSLAKAAHSLANFVEWALARETWPPVTLPLSNSYESLAICDSMNSTLESMRDSRS